MIWAVPSMADNCALPKISASLNLPYQAFPFPEIVPSAPITMGITFTLVVLLILLISRAWCLYFSIFSSSLVRTFWSAGTAMSIIVYSCVSLRTTVITGRLCLSRLSVKIVISQVSVQLNQKGCFGIRECGTMQ